ncbi:TetR/AcrR family transcriptional regulator [Nocardia sp. alder85J]|uniref:TetR/AcrR family transcriptional regulator n=1 Tax=Nocardia sp. alder85J TaxID=2862949 RepID=UPI001CD4C40D|nr:TetR/AcrR family transcriptional regulator [Nocardia sp. alder85J]MCX4091755.1 helix-turn-helix domain containing protein [Nocardia sp. alder85J]
MSRWAPDARERLEAAALDLFLENGYEQTTVAQIADRAGLNRATFFRHFADKREVLFGGEDLFAGLFADAIAAAPPETTLTGCLHAALAAADAVMTPQQRIKAHQRVRVIAANAEVQERGLLKHARIAGSIAAALRARGIDDLTARLGAEVGVLAFRIAVERWMAAGNDDAVGPDATASSGRLAPESFGQLAPESFGRLAPESFGRLAAAALEELQVRAAELDSGAGDS